MVALFVRSFLVTFRQGTIPYRCWSVKSSVAQLAFRPGRPAGCRDILIDVLHRWKRQYRRIWGEWRPRVCGRSAESVAAWRGGNRRIA